MYYDLKFVQFPGQSPRWFWLLNGVILLDVLDFFFSVDIGHCFRQLVQLTSVHLSIFVRTHFKMSLKRKCKDRVYFHCCKITSIILNMYPWLSDSFFMSKLNWNQWKKAIYHVTYVTVQFITKHKINRQNQVKKTLYAAYSGFGKKKYIRNWIV